MPSAGSTINGVAYILNSALASGQTFYALLTETLMNANSDMLAASQGEMSGNGYFRLPLTFSTAAQSQDGNQAVISNLIQLTATGGNIGPFQALCIVTNSSGAYGDVIAYVNYDQLQTILEGSVFSIQFPIEFIA